MYLASPPIYLLYFHATLLGSKLRWRAQETTLPCRAAFRRWLGGRSLQDTTSRTLPGQCTLEGKGSALEGDRAVCWLDRAGHTGIVSKFWNLGVAVGGFSHRSTEIKGEAFREPLSLVYARCRLCKIPCTTSDSSASHSCFSCGFGRSRQPGLRLQDAWDPPPARCPFTTLVTNFARTSVIPEGPG